MPQRVAWSWFWVSTISLSTAVPAAARAAAAVRPGTPSARIIHRFDFNERPEGNLEPFPKYWTPLPHPSFPSYTQGRFDLKIGHDAPPSFHVTSAGRDAAYAYHGPAMPVRPGSAYRVHGYVCPDRLSNARACLSAFYLDSQGRAIPESQARSAFIGGSAADDWTAVELYLSEAPEEAVSIGLAAWVLQEATWDASIASKRPVYRTDVHGGAWFDDITVFALPRLELGIYKQTSHDRHRKAAEASNLIQADEIAFLGFIAEGENHDDLSARITIRDLAGAVVKHHRASGAAADGFQIPLAGLPVGVYRADLKVTSGSTLVLDQSLWFAKLAPLRGAGRPAGAFGLILEPSLRLAPEVERTLLSAQHVRCLKIPVWPGMEDEDSRSASMDLLQDLVRSGFILTAVLAEPPQTLARAYAAYTRSVFDLLADDPQGWQPHLASAAASYANTFRWWQIGSDDGLGASQAEHLVEAVRNLQNVLHSYVVAPRLGLTVPSADRLDPIAGIDQLTVSIRGGGPISAYDELIADAKAVGAGQVAALIHPLAEDQYERMARLSDWAKQILFARHAGADVVFVPQTWTVRQMDRRRVAGPGEEYLIVRTLADAIGDALPGPRLALEDGIECLVFFDGNEAILAIWDRLAPAQGRRFPVPLAGAAAQIDLFGNETPLARDHRGRPILTLTPAPVFVRGVDRLMVGLAEGIRIEPAALDASVERADVSIRWKHDDAAAVTGQCELTPPAHWEVSPRTFRFALRPGQEESYGVTLGFAHNEPVGPKQLTARITLDSGAVLEIPLRFELQFPGLDVRAAALLEGDDLILRQTVRNDSQRILHLRGSASVPGRERQYRPFVNLDPGDIQTTEYRFLQAADLAGRRALLSLRELSDTTGSYTLEVRIP